MENPNPSGAAKSSENHWYRRKKLVLLLILVTLVSVILVTGAYLSSRSPENSPVSSAPSGANEAPATTAQQPAADQISWTEPQQLEDLRWFPAYTPNDEDGALGFEPFSSRYFKVGTITTGKYQGNDLITGIYGKNGDYYLATSAQGKFVLLGKYASADLRQDTSDFRSQPEIDWDYAIAELEYPDRITSPTADLVYDTPTPKMGLDPNASQEKKVALFTDPKWGTVYDADSDDQSLIALSLPDGLWVDYTLADMADAQNIKFSNGLGWSDYVAQPENGTGDWGEKDHPEYYQSSNLSPVGNVHGLPVYELTNRAQLQTLYTDMGGGNSEPYYPALTGMSFDSFVSHHPLLIWTDPFGRQQSMINHAFAECLGGAGKPVIYLYPQRSEAVSVQVKTPGKMTASVPDYQNGWKVEARPDGTLTDLRSGKAYPYLFWESEGGSGYSMPEKGFSVASNDLRAFFASTLPRYGLSQKESADFEAYWVPRLESEHSPYFFLTFTTTEKLQSYAPLTISPRPDTLIRIFLDYKAIPQPIAASEPEIVTPVRSGFTAVEWGGMLK